jgi:hypothetical protein
MDNDKINECCKDAKNLVEVNRTKAANRMDPSQKGFLVTRNCAICHRNHYELNVDPIKIGMD